MAGTLEQKRKQRFEFMRCLYEMSRGSERVLFYVEEVGDAVGLGALIRRPLRNISAKKGWSGW